MGYSEGSLLLLDCDGFSDCKNAGRDENDAHCFGCSEDQKLLPVLGGLINYNNFII